jgi:hypothetical protein
VFEGEVKSDNISYTKEKFISQERKVRAEGEVVLMKFRTVGVIEFKTN